LFRSAIYQGASWLKLAAQCTPEAQVLTLQDLLDGRAGANRYVAVTDFRLYDRYATAASRRRPHEPPLPHITHIGIRPARPNGAGDDPPGPPLVVIEPPWPEEAEHALARWGHLPAVSGILWEPYSLTAADAARLEATYPGISLAHRRGSTLPVCRVLREGREPWTVRWGWTHVIGGALGVALGLWLIPPGLAGRAWQRLRELTAVQPTTPGECGEAGPPPPAPWPDRFLAVAYVVSLAVQPVGFILLAGAGVFLWIRRRSPDGWSLGLLLGGLGCLVFCPAFRWWARRRGQRR